MRSDKKAEFGPKFGVGTPLYRHHTTSLVFNDPPLHTRVRKLLAAAFTPRALANLQPRIEAVVDGLLDEHADRGTMDLVEDFAFRLPVEVICDMLGVPPGDRAPFRRYSLAILGALEPVAGPERQARGNAAPPTATPTSSPSQTVSTPGASPIAMSPLARASTCAWAPCWPASRAPSPSAA